MPMKQKESEIIIQEKEIMKLNYMPCCSLKVVGISLPSRKKDRVL